MILNKTLDYNSDKFICQYFKLAFSFSSLTKK